MLFYRTDKIYSKVSAYPQINWSFPLLRAQIICFFFGENLKSEITLSTTVLIEHLRDFILMKFNN